MIHVSYCCLLLKQQNCTAIKMNALNMFIFYKYVPTKCLHQNSIANVFAFFLSKKRTLTIYKRNMIMNFKRKKGMDLLYFMVLSVHNHTMNSSTILMSYLSLRSPYNNCISFGA